MTPSLNSTWLVRTAVWLLVGVAALTTVSTCGTPLTPKARAVSGAPGQPANQESGPAAALDTYGGLTALPAPGGATGFFRVAKIGQRWVFVTPEGNAFWMRSVYHANESFIDPAVIAAKYAGDANRWATHRNRRLLAWGFNALGEYTSARGLPVGTWGSRKGNDVKLPFILLLSPALTSSIGASSAGVRELVKDIIAGVPSSTYADYRGRLVDIYDPKFSQASANEVAYWSKAIGGGFADKPWVLGITTDDADVLFGFKSRGGAPVVAYPHPAFLVATAKFSYSPAEHPKKEAWGDPKLYSKYAWVEWLKTKYKTVAELNAAWGTKGFYTSFDSDGGYGSGTGVLDEDGHTAWMGTMKAPYKNTGASPGVASDLDAFLYEFARHYAQVVVGAIRAVDSNHLIFGPASLNNYGAKARDEVLRGLSDGGIDVFCWNYDPRKPDMSEDNQSYDLVGKPAFIWYTVSANADSGWYRQPPIWGAPNFATQELRGKHYASIDLPAFLNARGANGDYYVVGLNWWELVDSGPSEHGNWGLLTHKDNAYDGKEAVTQTGVDAWGLPTGGEERNYGDFLSFVSKANAAIMPRVQDQAGRPPERPGSEGRRPEKEQQPER